MRFTWIGALSLVLYSDYASALIGDDKLFQIEDLVQVDPRYAHLSPEVPFALLKQGNINTECRYMSPDKDPVIRFIQHSFNCVNSNPVSMGIRPVAKQGSRFVGPSTVGVILKRLFSLDPSRIPKKGSEELKTWIKEIEQDADFLKLKQKADDTAQEVDKQYQAECADWKTQYKEHSAAKSNYANLTKKKAYQQRMLSDLQAKLLDCSAKQKPLNAIQSQIKSLEDFIGKLDKQLEDHNRELVKKLPSKELDTHCKKLEGQIAANTYKSSDFENFLNVMLEAWASDLQTVQDPSKKKFADYLKWHSSQKKVETFLMSIGIMNAENEKSELIKLYRGLPLTPESQTKIENPELVEQFLKSRYNQEHFSEDFKNVFARSQVDKAKYILDHPIKPILLNYGEEVFSNKPFELTSQNISYVHSKYNTTISYHDCMETSVLTFLSNLLKKKDPVTGKMYFAVNLLEENLKKQGFLLDPGIKTFLQKYNTVDALNSSEAHHEFAKLVNEILPNESYVKPSDAPYAELRPFASNIFGILSKFFYSTTNPNNPPKFDFKALDPNQKMNTICSSLSLNNQKVTWKLSGVTQEDFNNGHKDTGFEFEFSGFADLPIQWSLKPGHSQVTVLKEATDLGGSILELLANRNRPLLPAEFRTLGWYLKGTSDQVKTLMGNVGRLGKSIHKALLSSLPTTHNEDKVALLETAFEHEYRIHPEKVIEDMQAGNIHTDTYLAKLLFQYQPDPESPAENKHLANNRAEADKILKKYTDPQDQGIILFDVINNKYDQLLTELVRLKYDMATAKTKAHESPLGAAILAKNEYAATTILNELTPAQANQPNSEGETPLQKLVSARGNFTLASAIAKKLTPIELEATNSSLQNPIYKATTPNLVRFVSKLHPEWFNSQNVSGIPPFSSICGRRPDGLIDKLDILKTYLTLNPKLISERDSKGNLPIHHAAAAGDLEILEWMVREHAASVNEKNNKGETPLHHILSSRLPSLETVKYLLKLDHEPTGTNLLLVSASNPAMTQETLSFLDHLNPSWISEKSKTGETALDIATRSGSADAMGYFLNKAPTSQLDLSTLFEKVLNHPENLLMHQKAGYLLERDPGIPKKMADSPHLWLSPAKEDPTYGYKVWLYKLLRDDPKIASKKTIEGDNVFHLLAADPELFKNRGGIDEPQIEKLISANPKLLSEKNHSGETPVSAALETANDSLLKLMIRQNPELLLEQDDRGNTVFHSLSKGIKSPAFKDLFQLIYDKKPELFSKRNRDEESPLLTAASVPILPFTTNQKTLNFEFLIKHDPHPFQQRNQHGENILHLLAKAKDSSTFQHVVQEHQREAGELSLQKDQQGNTPLHVAAQVGDPTITRIIMYLKPELAQEPNHHGKTPLDLAMGANHEAIVSVLKNLKAK